MITLTVTGVVISPPSDPDSPVPHMTLAYPFPDNQTPENSKNQFKYFGVSVNSGKVVFSYYSSEGIRVNTRTSGQGHVLPGNIVDLYEGRVRSDGYVIYYRLGSFTVSDKTTTIKLGF